MGFLLPIIAICIIVIFVCTAKSGHVWDDNGRWGHPRRWHYYSNPFRN